MLMLCWISLNPNLGGWGKRVILLTPCWFSLDNSETVKAVTLAFCRIQWHFIREVLVKFGILHSPQSPDIGQNSDELFSDFRTRASDNIDMKLGSITKLDKRKETKSKKFDEDFISEIVTSLSFFQFTANLEQSRSRISDAYPVKLFAFQKLKTELKNL